jgi:integrase
LQAVLALEWHRQHISTFKKAENYIFSNGNGEPLDPDHLREAVLYPAYEKANGVLPVGQIVRKPREYGFHICRHTAGSEMIEETGDPTKAQRQLGHSSIEMTVNVYGHQIGNADERAAQQLADKLFPTLSLPESSDVGFITRVLPEGTKDGAVEEVLVA